MNTEPTSTVPASCRCDGCGTLIAVRTDRHAQYVSGWCEKPKKGAVTVTPTRWEQRFACGGCVDRMGSAKIEWQQETLFTLD